MSELKISASVSQLGVAMQKQKSTAAGAIDRTVVDPVVSLLCAANIAVAKFASRRARRAKGQPTPKRRFENLAHSTSASKDAQGRQEEEGQGRHGC